MMAPGASVDDGRFDFVLAPEVSKATVVAILLRLLKGTHVEHPKVVFKRTSCLTIESWPGTPIHADGEILGTAVSSITYQVLPGKLTLLSPAK
jgi:diacylglycerol kinase (ATP)